MTVSMQLTKRIYAGNGLTRTWEVDFPLASLNDIRVFITSPAGDETPVTEDYELNEDGTQLTYPTEVSGKNPLAQGWTITLLRQTPLTQEIDLLRQGELDAEVLESGYDKLTLLVQELSEKLDRSIKYPVSTQPVSLDAGDFLNKILTAKQEALTASSQASEAAHTAGESATVAAQISQTAVSNIENAVQTGQTALANQSAALSQALATHVTEAQQAAQNAQYYAQHTLGKNIGEVYFSESSSAQDNPGALPLFTGETISNADQLYPDFYNWVLNHSALQTSAADYEAAITTYGECPKYVIDDTNKTIRLPKLVNYLKMANTTDGVTQSTAGLPDAQGNLNAWLASTSYNPTDLSADGVFADTTFNDGGDGGSGQYANARPNFKLSKGNSIYGNSDTVTPAHTTLFPWVCAYNAAIPASTAQAAEFLAALSSKADTDLANCTRPYVIEIYVNGTSWYRVWSDGWCEQGGIANGSGASISVSFLRPFKTNVSCIQVQNQTSSTNTTICTNKANTITTSGFVIVKSNSNDFSFFWVARGYIS